jgi:hypothetical protein
MKSLRIQVMFLVLLLLPAASAFAGTGANKGSLTIGEPVQAAGQQLAAGEYKLKWEGTGSTAQVNIIRDDGKVVATVPARIVELQQKPTQDSAEIKTAGDGARVLTKIEFQGKTYALEIGDQAGGGDAGSGSSVK